MDLDDAYANKNALCQSILQYVRKQMAAYGYAIINVLVTDLAPEASVLQAMNQINASRRQREASIEQGEAQKILRVKAAEAEAEAKYLSGVGVGNMRKAMAEGYKDSLQSMIDGGLNPQESMHLILTTQYLDALGTFATNPSPSAIMVPHGPGAVEEIESQVRKGFGGQSSVNPPRQALMPTPATRVR